MSNSRASVQEADLKLLLKKSPRFNLLLIGRGRRASKILDTILLNHSDPRTAWFPGRHLVLPPVAQTDTLILTEVGALELDEQLRLYEWMDRVQGRTQIVSTSEAHLLPRVDAGAFLEALYYRLNTVCIDVST